ncbi:hypothetical protein [Natronorubrum sulfidifaciens]|uniref:Uncharacterized protein n=1 Tax=Natronorubrum sulfidifaciens JCM 14089 TaxID=1230460 RepID=L9WG53_9EURY|nr:hypothetical protein [Natronorubrum sulfidifaciens]ELY47303.1 hypothetical protein C495_03557 [Natronorubrum sulfidifaciens JCM 14089]
MVNRKESAADIRVNVGEEQVPVEQLSVTKDIEIETIYGAGNIIPSGFAITQIEYSGNMTVKGNKKDLEDKFFDGNGVPKVLPAIVITHLNGDATSYDTVLVTSQGYEVTSGETTETSFEFVAMSKDEDTNPTDAA